jgi:uncharacterized LabA/DUF88 family protein
MSKILPQINLGWAERLTESLRAAARRLFLAKNPQNRTIFLIDGFNLYHSLRDASHDLGLKGRQTRWLDIFGLCQSYLSNIGNNAQICGIYYFSAIAKYLLSVVPDIEARHRAYAECLADTGVTVEFARFKKKKSGCPHCTKNITRHEEKETDVAIAAKLLEICFLDQCDTVIIVSGDTDIVPAVHTARRLFPKKEIGFLLPYKRHNKELKTISRLHFSIARTTYAKHQFPDPYVTSNGKQINKPPKW